MSFGRFTKIQLTLQLEPKLPITGGWSKLFPSISAVALRLPPATIFNRFAVSVAISEKLPGKSMRKQANNVRSPPGRFFQVARVKLLVKDGEPRGIDTAPCA